MLNTPTDQRQRNLDEDLAGLPYVNGELFAERLRFADFNSAMRTALLECCNFRWEKISPAVFGSLFQNIMQPRQRRQIGAHYTSERDIMKLIRSLFLDELREEFEKARRDKRALARLHRRLAEMKFLDPACGCGNFLVLAYRELRQLELDIIAARFDDNPTEGDIRAEARLNVGQFHGIEIEEWPVRIAEVAMWLMDHQMNNALFERFGKQKATVPLTDSPHIMQANALRIDWNDLLPAAECTYVFGNPPFVGKHYRTKDQSDDLRALLPSFRNVGDIDYVVGWYFKAAAYMHQAKQMEVSILCGLVSTNSITQGEQAAIIWPNLFHRYPGLEFIFGHRTFRWASEARGKAHVHVVIIGIGFETKRRKYLFDYDEDPEHPAVTEANSISPYLVDAPQTHVIQKQQKPLCDVPEMRCGNKPSDGGHLILTDAEKEALLTAEPGAKKYLRQFTGSREFLNGNMRWCLWLADADPVSLRSLPLVMQRVEEVRRFRLKSTAAPTRKAATTPTCFFFISQPDSGYILIPEVSSERREYIPIGFAPKTLISANTNFVIPSDDLFLFGVMTSAMHMAWVRQVCGRLESRYRYSAKLVYNTFPWPQDVTDAKRRRVEDAAQGVLDARALYEQATLADLYDPLAMPAPLRKAHDKLDKAVDLCYRPQPFVSERNRLEFLFDLYESLIAPLRMTKKKKRTRRRRS